MAELIKDGSDANATYAYEDIRDGFGLETYYLHARIEASGTGTETTTYHMSKDGTIASEAISVPLSFAAITACGDALTAETQATKITFSTGTFNLPKVLNGTAIIDFCYAYQDAGSSTFYPLVEIYHYDGSTETQLGSSWYGKAAASSSSAVTIKRAVAYMALGRKKFRKGDTLRIKIGGAACGSGGDTSAGTVSIGIDPLNRDSTSLITPSTDDPQSTTVFKARIPFEVSV